MNTETTFSLVYWTNLGRNQERRFAMEEALERADLPAKRFRAIDARFVKNTRGHSNPESYAHTLTQRLALRSAMLASADAVLLLGDNVTFRPDIKSILDEVDLPDDWGILLLGCTHRERPLPYSQGIVKVTDASGTYAFAVRAPYYKQVLAALKACTQACSCHSYSADSLFGGLLQSVPIYACYPDLVRETEPSYPSPAHEADCDNGDTPARPDPLRGFHAEVWGGSRWNPNETQPSDPAPPKLGLLFLTRGNVNHPEIWKEFLEGAIGDVTALAHVKTPGEAGILTPYLIPELHDTCWGDISLVRAMLALLREGLAHSDITHFAFVSESCVPIKPWREMKRLLRIDPRSMMDLEDSSSMQKKHFRRLQSIRRLPENVMLKHSQWVLLDRAAASCVSEHDFTMHFSSIEAPDEHYFGSVLAMRGFPIQERVRFTPLTWLKWETWPITTPTCHKETDCSMAIDLATFPGFFARKFPPNSDIAKWGLHRAGI